jgi:hypothetical protein
MRIRFATRGLSALLAIGLHAQRELDLLTTELDFTVSFVITIQIAVDFECSEG